MMKAMCSSETSVLTRATRRNIPKDVILHNLRREKLKSYIRFWCSFGETEGSHVDIRIAGVPAKIRIGHRRYTDQKLAGIKRANTHRSGRNLKSLRNYCGEWADAGYPDNLLNGKRSFNLIAVLRTGKGEMCMNLRGKEVRYFQLSAWRGAGYIPTFWASWLGKSNGLHWRRESVSISNGGITVGISPCFRNALPAITEYPLIRAGPCWLFAMPHTGWCSLVTEVALKISL
jgi:hypothetical protein